MSDNTNPAPLALRKGRAMPETLSKDSDAKLIDPDSSNDELGDPVSLLINMLIYGPSAASDPTYAWYAQYAQARLNAYVFLRDGRHLGGNPLDPLDFASSSFEI